MPVHDNTSTKKLDYRIHSSRMVQPHRYSWETKITNTNTSKQAFKFTAALF